MARSTVVWSPAHPDVRMNVASNLPATLRMHAASTDSPLAAALALQMSLPAAFLPATRSRAASHVLGPPSGRSPRMTSAHTSAIDSHTVASPEHEPAFANAMLYLPCTA